MLASSTKQERLRCLEWGSEGLAALGIPDLQVWVDVNCSHRNLIKELNEHHRKKSLKEIKAIHEKVEKMAMDATWIKIDKLKTMSLQEIADLIGTSTE